MRTISCALLGAALLASLACGGTTATTTAGGPVSAATDPALTSATVTFRTLADGKDRDSAVSVQLLRRNNELGAEMRSVGMEFEDNTQGVPLALSIAGPFRANDVEDGQLRIRLTPDGDDTWAFDGRLVMTFSDGTQRTFGWSTVRLDERAPERTLPLAPARVTE